MSRKKEPTVAANRPHGLTALQARFCEALVENGGDRQAALRAAGYTGNAHRSRAHAILKGPKVQAYIAQLTVQRIGLSAPMALATLIRLAQGARSEFVQQQAAADLLNRAGFKPPDRHQLAVAGQVSIDIKLTDD